MLRVQHGASRLSSPICKATFGAMSSYEGTPAFANDAMRSTLAKLRGGNGASPSRTPYKPPSLSTTWQPTHGIVFHSLAPVSNRKYTSSTCLPSLEKGMMKHSMAEDNYVLAASNQLSELVSEEKACEESRDMSGESLTPPEMVMSQEHARENIPETTFAFRPTEELFRKAKNAPPQSSDSYWSHTMYRGPASPGEEGPRVKVHYCSSLHTSERVLSQYFMSEKVLGFDIEWKYDASRFAGPKEKVSLIQLASEQRIALLHVALYPGDHISALVAPSLKKLMEDPNISKVGVNIKGDCTRLRHNLKINAEGVFELSHLYKLIKYSVSKDFKLINKKPVSMATQVMEHLHLPMFKGMDVRGSDWSKKLNMDQITYAAGDSYAGLQLYNVMDLKRSKIDPCPPMPYHVELDKPIRLAEGVDIGINEVVEDGQILEPAVDKPLRDRTTRRRLPNPAIQEEQDDDVLKSESEFEPSDEYYTPPSTPSDFSTAKTKTVSKISTRKHPLSIEAEQLIIDYQAGRAHTTPSNRASMAHLRSYFIWAKNPSLSIPEIAAVLREPPLRTGTVAAYILEAVRLDGKYLADGNWDRSRIQEVLSVWKRHGGGKGWMERRYWQLEKELAEFDVQQSNDEGS